MRSTLNTYSLAIVATQQTRNQLCATIGVNRYGIETELQSGRYAEIDHYVDVVKEGATKRFHFCLSFYKPETFSSNFLDDARTDATIFAIGMNESGNPSLIEDCARHVMLTEQKIGVQVFRTTEKTKYLECFNDFMPDNQFTLRDNEPANNFLEKLTTTLERLREEARVLFNSYREFTSQQQEAIPARAAQLGSSFPLPLTRLFANFGVMPYPPHQETTVDEEASLRLFPNNHRH